MGGIPFKSTGCNTCRRRKVKCDETKPECLRCVKNGHVCTGYERQRVFIHKSPSTVQDSQKLVERPRDNTTRSNKPGAIIRVDPVRVITGSSSIPHFDARPEIRSQLLSSFVDSFLPPAQYLQTGRNKNLYEQLPDLVGGSPLLDKAITSLSSAFVAKHHQDDRLLRYSTRLYSQAMAILQGIIRMGRGFSKDLLYTMIIFQVYELVNCSPSGFPAWLAHVQGSNAMVRQCGDQNDVSLPEILFLRQLRFVILCDAVGTRKAASRYNIPSFPAHSPGSSFEIEPVDKFIDILVDCTALLEEVDRFLEYGDEGFVRSRQEGEHLLHSCLSLEGKLHNTCIEMQAKLGVPSSLPRNARSLKEFRAFIPKDFFPLPLQFPSLSCAESHMLYWTTLILLYPLIYQLLDFLGSSESHAASTSECYSYIETGPRTENTTTNTTTTYLQNETDFLALTDVYATEVCRSAAYCLQSNMKALGGQMLLAPLSQCTQFFQVQQSIEKTQWCQAIFMILPQLGFGIGPFLKDMVWPQYRAAQKRKSPTPSTPSEQGEVHQGGAVTVGAGPGYIGEERIFGNVHDIA